MAAALREEIDGTHDIDMERVVADPEYRRRVVARLRQARLLAEAQRPKAADVFDIAAGDED